jgi:hypothetical protein
MIGCAVSRHHFGNREIPSICLPLCTVDKEVSVASVRQENDANDHFFLV